MAVVTTLLDKGAIDPALAARYFAPDAVAARTALAAELRDSDWPALNRYRPVNGDVANPDLVMIGDSLTEIWTLAEPELFGAKIVNRGISGQTSAQILLRFMPDVIDLRPAHVHILCGTNDIAGNTGPNAPEDYQRNVRAMIDLAQGNGVTVLLATMPPADAIFWSPDARPLEWIPYLNDWLRSLANTRGCRLIDYHAALNDGRGALREEYSADGVHVSRTAYRLMRTLLAEACSAVG